MRFSDDQIALLRNNVENKLSKKRYVHTLGVEQAARYIGAFFDDLDISELSAAALLHDITKEYSLAEHKKLLKSYSVILSESDMAIEAVLHSLTAPYAVLSSFSEYATSEILSAIRNHTLGSPDMSIFDEIIFISDYVEDGRVYPACVEVRECLYRDLQSAKCADDLRLSLHRAVVNSLDYTISSLRARGSKVHEQTIVTFNTFAAKLI